MITKVILRNAQTHEHKVLELGPGVTTLTGGTDRGKSTVLRQLRLLVLNRPAGVAYIRHGADKSMVGVVAEGRKVTRTKTAKTTVYKLDGETFHAAGQGDPPKEIQAALNLTEANFHRQGDSPFWFYDTPGQVSRQLNEFASLDDIDHVLDGAGSLVRGATIDLRVAETALTNAARREAALAWVPAMLKRAAELEDAQAKHEEAEQGVATLLALIEEVRGLSATRKSLRSALEAGKRVVEAGQLAEKARKRAEALEQVVQTAQSAQSAKNEKVLGRLFRQWDVILEVRKKADAVSATARDLEMWITAARSAEEEKCRLTTELEEAEAQLKLVKPTACPTCGQPLPASASASPTSTSKPPPRRVAARRPIGRP